MNIDKCIKNLERRGHKVHYFETGKEAAEYINSTLCNTEIGIGGCITADQLGLYETLSKNNVVYWHWKDSSPDVKEKANASPVYITGVNAMSEDGEIINIDGSGNRLAAQVYGKKKVVFICGTNKICPDFSSAVTRARQIAATKNAKRFDIKTPCKIDGKCHDCTCSDSICNAMLVIWGPMNCGMETDVVIINEELGY